MIPCGIYSTVGGPYNNFCSPVALCVIITYYGIQFVAKGDDSNNNDDEDLIFC